LVSCRAEHSVCHRSSWIGSCCCFGGLPGLLQLIDCNLNRQEPPAIDCLNKPRQHSLAVEKSMTITSPNFDEVVHRKHRSSIGLHPSHHGTLWLANVVVTFIDRSYCPYQGTRKDTTIHSLFTIHDTVTAADRRRCVTCRQWEWTRMMSKAGGHRSDTNRERPVSFPIFIFCRVAFAWLRDPSDDNPSSWGAQLSSCQTVRHLK
jgi:hypothetical protein